jgi:hypothetical protein
VLFTTISVKLAAIRDKVPNHVRCSGTNVKRRFYWVVVGGLAFWVPVVAAGAILRDQTGLLSLNLPPLIALSIVGLESWIRGRKAQWGWVLLGIYILGPAAMLLPSSFGLGHAPPRPGDTLFLVAFCLFPPMTLWLAVLNGTIFSVLLATVALPLLASRHTPNDKLT